MHCSLTVELRKVWFICCYSCAEQRDGAVVSWLFILFIDGGTEQKIGVGNAKSAPRKFCSLIIHNECMKKYTVYVTRGIRLLLVWSSLLKLLIFLQLAKDYMYISVLGHIADI